MEPRPRQQSALIQKPQQGVCAACLAQHIADLRCDGVSASAMVAQTSVLELAEDVD